MGIDVIIPVYNCEKHIKESIESVLNQTYDDWNLILVNDGSTDTSGNICDEYAKKDSRIAVIHQENRGVSAARNIGIISSKNEFFCFLDSDDLYEPTALGKMVDILRDNSVDAAYFNMIDLYQNKAIPKQPRLLTGKYDFDDISNILIDDGTMTGILFGSACAVIYKRNIVKQFNIYFDENITKNEDGIFNIKYISECSKIYYDGENYIYKYRHWKTLKNNSDLAFNPVWEKTNEIITNIYINKKCDVKNLEIQLALRNISIAFWTILTVGNSKKNIFVCAKFINSILKNHCVSENFTYLNNKISSSKRLISFLMKRRCCLSLSILFKKVLPLIRKIGN